MRRLVPGFVLAFVVALVGVVLTGIPAQACSCKASDMKQNERRADAVFSGTVISVQKPPSEANSSVIMILVEAERSWKGRVPTKVELTTSANPAACGVDNLKADKTYLFFAQSDRAKLTIDSCGGTALFTAELGDGITRLRGEGTSPGAPEEPAAEPPTADREVIDDSKPVGFMRIAAPGGALIILGLLGLLVLGRVGRVRQD